MENRIIEELKRRIIANNFQPFTITMKTDGNKIEITPCIYTERLTISNVEYYLVGDCKRVMYGAENLSGIAKQIINYNSLKAEQKKNEDDIEAFFHKYIAGGKYTENRDAFDFYSDWHKDVFGYRPRRLMSCPD